MPTYDRRERTTIRVEFVVPASPYFACWTDVMAAIHAAHGELVEIGRIKAGADAPDDLIRLAPCDDTVIVYYEREEVRP